MQVTKQMSQLSIPALARNFAAEDVENIASPAATECNMENSQCAQEVFFRQLI